jgi:hypothetical protein
MVKMEGERERENKKEIESNEKMGWQLDSVFSELLFVDSFLTVHLSFSF